MMIRPLHKPFSLLSLFALVLSVLLLPAPVQAASTCPGFIPATINTPALLVTAVQQAQSGNCPGADTIDLDGNTIAFDLPFATYDGAATALPQITSAVTLTGGTVARSTAGGTPAFRLLNNAAGGNLTLVGMTLRNGNAGNAVANRGGAISNAGTLSVQQSTLTSNYAYDTGAIYNAAGATATVSRSALSSNVATRAASAITSLGTLSLSNSTVTGNSTTSGAGAVLNDAGGVATLVNVTISDNESLTGNSSGGLNSLGNLTLYNSILANNTGFDCARLGGTITFSPGATNLVEAQRPGLECGVAGVNFVAVDPQLGALTGSPAYYPLTAGSLPVSGGDNASTGGATLDQPGNVRVQQGTVDLGAVESPFARQLASVAFAAGTSSASEAAGIGNVIRVTTNDGAPTENPITATLAVTGGTATAPDYVLTGTLSIPAGTANNALVSVASAIMVVNDNISEPNETLVLTLSAPVNASLGAQVSSTHTINNDDVGTVTIADVSRAEGDAGTSTMIFTATLDNPVQGGFTVDYATADITASAGSDYTAASGTMVFAGNAGETQTIAVVVNGDTLVEPDETFRVAMIVAASQAMVIITDTAVGTIVNDDVATVSIANASISEGNGGTSTMTFTATLDKPVQGGFSLNYATANGTATTADGDYVAASGVLSFVGIAGEARTFSVTVNGDTKVEPNETFNILLNGVSNAGVTVPATVTGTIVNDDNAALTVTDVAITEGNAGTSNMIFTVTLDNAVAGGFTVNYATTDGTATTADNDYVAATGTLAFTGTAGQARTFIVLVNGDTKVEPNETFTVSLNTVSHAGVTITDTATGTITNNDSAAVTVANVSQPESGTFTFTVTLSNAVQGGVSVDYQASSGTAVAGSDFTATSGTLNFAGTSGETRTFTVPVVDDSLVEPTETFNVSLANASVADVNASDTAIGTITDNDTSAVTIADASLVEGNTGTQLMTFTATLGNGVQGGFTVNYATSDLSASVADADYVAATGTLTFAGTAGETQTFAVTINGDTKIEPDETFRVAMNTASAAAVNVIDTATGTLVNDDTAALTITDAGRDEGNAGPAPLTFTVTLGSAVQGGFTVNYATADGTATVANNDYTAASGTLTFAGQAGETHSFSVNVNGDTQPEPDETFGVALSGVSNTAVDVSDTATGTIRNDDAVVVSVGDVSVNEGNAGTTSMTFTVTTNGAVPGGFAVNYATADGTATVADGDYVAASGTLAFTGTAGETQTFSVTLNGDAKVEADETFSVALSTTSAALLDVSDTATGTIRNDDTAAVTLADASVVEGNAGTSLLTFTATLDHAVAGGFTVDYATSDGTATVADNDYVAATGTLTFAGTAGETQTFSVTINGDTRLEPAEAFTVALSGVSNTAVIITDTATGTIGNDDTAAVTVADASVSEGNAGTTVMTFTATLDHAVAGGFTVNYATANGTATVADGDYVAATGTLAFAGTAGETQTFSVTINGDTRVEADETFGVTLGNASNAGVNTTDTATGTIRNDDTAAVTVADVSLVEGNAGTSTMTFTATLDHAVAGGLTVNYATADGTATVADNDYVAATGTLTFAGTAGETQTFAVTIVGDNRSEPDEAFTVALNSASQGAVVTSDTAVGTLLDDDAAPGFVVTPASGLVTSEAGGTATFTVALASAPAAAVTLALSSSDTSEGTVSTAALVFDATNWNSPQTVTVTGVDDSVVDGDVAYAIVTAPAVSADPAFDALDPSDVSVTNRDDDAGALLSATKRVAQVGTAAQPVIYEIVVTNGGALQADDPASDELVDVLPAALALQSATASAGSVTTAGNTVRWNGALAAGATVTLRIEARVATTIAGPISNQAQLNYDSDADGSNDATALSDDPTTPAADATVFGFAPASVAIPLLDPVRLAWLALCLTALGLAALRRRRA